MMRRGRRGYVLFLTITFGVAVLLLLIAVAPGSSLFRMQTQREKRLAVEDAARGTLDLACSALLYQADFGGKSTLKWTPQQPIAVSGALGFDPNSGVAYSSNNFYGVDRVQGWGGRTVPPGQVHLVARGDGDGASSVHQALVQPFRRLLVEDFNDDHQGARARLDWKAFPDTRGFQIRNGYMYLGSTEYQKNKAQWQVVQSDEWDDVDLQVHVAYYGTANFGFSLRTNNSFEGYRLELQPQVGMESIDGMDATVVAVTGSGTNALPYPEAAQLLKDPLFKVDRDLTEQPAEWTLQASIQGSQLWLSVWDPALAAFRQVGTPWDLSKFGPGLQKAGSAPSFEKGGVGVWCQFATGIGFTNVELNRREAMLRVQSRWEP